ncbi:hypothetical protein ACFQ07_01660, partial [Actinomadura adrarensis]
MLADAGLEESGEGEGVFLPLFAWLLVREAVAGPPVEVQRFPADAVDVVNAAWFRLAGEFGLFGEEREFLLDLEAGGTLDCCDDGPRNWARVRLVEERVLVGALSGDGGRPDFLALSLDGSVLLSVTTEGPSEIVVRVLDRPKDRAEAMARETPEERERAWASFFEGPPPTERLLSRWERGLLWSRSAPDDVLIGMLDRGWNALRWRRGLSSAVVDAALTHPLRKVRVAFSEEYRDITSEQRARSILAEQNPRWRAELTMLAAEFGAELPGPVIERLGSDSAAVVRAEVPRLPGTPVRLLRALVMDD